MTASPRWIDANTHDPGITILELLVYSIVALTFALAVRHRRGRRRRCTTDVG